MSQDPDTGRVGERPLSWPCRIAYALALLIAAYILTLGVLRP